MDAHRRAGRAFAAGGQIPSTIRVGLGKDVSETTVRSALASQ